jgi:hypothetical protein
MPVSRLSTWEEVVVLWFSVSVAIQILSGVALWLWLVIHEVKVTFVFVGFPGYVERCYMQWRRSQGRSYRLVISLRIASAANTIAAALIALPILVGPQPGHNAEVEVSSLSLSHLQFNHEAGRIPVDINTLRYCLWLLQIFVCLGIVAPPL